MIKKLIQKFRNLRRRSGMNDSDQLGKIHFIAGYDIFWDKHGIKIETTDYHAGTLDLPWETILDLFKRARPQMQDIGKPRGKVRNK
jgi:hypothetical protein